MTHPLGWLLISTSWKSASKPLSVSGLSTNSFRCANTKANAANSSITKYCLPSSKRNCTHTLGNHKGCNYFAKSLIANGMNTSQCAVKNKLSCNQGVCSCDYCFIDCLLKPSTPAIQTDQITTTSSSALLSDDIEYFLSKSKSSLLLQHHANLKVNNNLVKSQLLSDDITVDKGPLLANISKSKKGKINKDISLISSLKMFN